MTKQEVLQKIDETPNIPKGELKFMINSISTKSETRITRIVIGDVFVHKLLRHPCLVIHHIPKTENFICVGLTTSPKDEILLTQVDCRFNESPQYATNSMMVAEKNTIAENYMFTIERKETLRVKKAFMVFLKASFQNL